MRLATRPRPTRPATRPAAVRTTARAPGCRAWGPMRRAAASRRASSAPMTRAVAPISAATPWPTPAAPTAWARRAARRARPATRAAVRASRAIRTASARPCSVTRDLPVAPRSAAIRRRSFPMRPPTIATTAAGASRARTTRRARLGHFASTTSARMAWAPAPRPLPETKPKTKMPRRCHAGTGARADGVPGVMLANAATRRLPGAR
jgi:hypothetical protein